MRSDPKRTAKRGRKKSNLFSATVAARKRVAGEAETPAPVSSNPGSQSSHKKRAISLADWLETECDFRNLATEETEWCCKYEHLRESKGFREGLANPKCEALPVVACADWMDNARLVFALKKAGYPVPWKKLSAESRANLTQVLCWNSKDQKRHPVLMAQEFALAHDPLEEERLLEQWRETAYYTAALDRNYLFGVFRLDETYNESEAVKAFAAWFKERYAQTKGGGAPDWRAKLNDLAVMRLRKRFPGKRNLIRRVLHVAELTTAGFAGCRAFRDDRQKARREKREVEQRMSKAASEEMSRARGDALKFFQTFFPRKIPLNY
jgi:hypothetical protein